MNYKLDKNKRYLLACSYGPDSMALFDMLRKENIYFEVAHVNYKLRDESDFETESLKNYCDELGIKIHTLINEQNLMNSNVEAKCRNIRYEFFRSLYKNFDALLVAHHEDDLIETFILQKKRKSLVNYYGIKQESEGFGMLIVRPLLDKKKRDLKGYCDFHKIPYAIDKSNLENTYLRNKIRHSIVEKLTEGERKNILHEIKIENNKLLAIKEKISQIDINNCQDLLSLNEREFAFALTELSRREKPNASLSLNCTKEIRKILESNKPNILFKINLSLNFIKEYEKVYFRANLSSYNYEYVLEKPGKLDTPYFSLDFTNGGENRNVFDDSYPIKIRNAKKEDKYLIKNYIKKVNRLFIDWKMPNSLRKRWPVIINKEGKIIYIPRYRKDFKPDNTTNFIVK
ncbi:MAG: tRNA lysidine(34) synthetase TilS [Bacilli bacterium]|nr:tRNA lysidine(34) synthetase TilS [Bacilli bacterium]